MRTAKTDLVVVPMTRLSRSTRTLRSGVLLVTRMGTVNLAGAQPEGREPIFSVDGVGGGTSGTAGVRKVRSPPLVVPAALMARTR